MAIDRANAIRWTALAGTMGTRTFYLTALTLQAAVRYFEPTPSILPAEYRTARAPSRRRVCDLQTYLTGGQGDWVLGSITVAYDGEIEYDAAEHALYLASSTDFVVTEGQHRLAAIRRAIVDDPELRKQSIGVTLLPFEDLARNEKLFSDLNHALVKTSRSIEIFHNVSDPLSDLVRQVATEVPMFNSRIDYRSTGVTSGSKNFMALATLYDACLQLLGGPELLYALWDEDTLRAAKDFCVRYWTKLSDVIQPWRAVRDGEVDVHVPREQTMVMHPVAIYALALAGAQLLNITAPRDWSTVTDDDLEQLEPLRAVDWRRSNEAWIGIVIMDGVVVALRETRLALARELCFILDPERFPHGFTPRGDWGSVQQARFGTAAH